VVLDVHPEPADHRNRILASEFEVDLVLTSDNADARRYTARVSYDRVSPGQPDENRIWDHLAVEIANR
jgi:hypothetical protein